jgi:sulfate adenylyltransferase subunit 1
VQYVARDGTGAGVQARTLFGRIARGTVKRGDEIEVFPGGQAAIVREVRRAGDAVAAAHAGQSVGLVLDRQLDVSRGDWIGEPASLRPVQRFHATLAWLDTERAVVGRKYWLRHGNAWVAARITAIESRLDIQTLQPAAADELAVNDIGNVVVETQKPLPLEAYAQDRVGGAMILVDPASNRTSGALLVKQPDVQPGVQPEVQPGEQPGTR